MRVPYSTVKSTIKKAFLNAGLTEEQAEICAETHATTSLEGVQSHGLNRVARFCDLVRNGSVDPKAKCELVSAKGAAENYDGHRGIGILNAKFCAARAIELAKIHGIGLVALRNTTHWMRGGTYAWDTAKAGYMSICWTNTEPCMPVWGAKSSSIGNNPFCIGIPRENGPIVLDMAMAQYSFGKLQVTRLAGDRLPYPGGFDKAGNLTDDPAAIEETKRVLPVGYWKGSGMAIALDMAAAMMSAGQPGHRIDAKKDGSCAGCSQIFIAYDPYLFSSREDVQQMLDGIVETIHNAEPVEEGGKVYFPGERTAITRETNLEAGVVVDPRVWEEVCLLAEGAELALNPELESK